MIFLLAILFAAAFAGAVLYRFNRDLADEKQFRVELRGSPSVPRPPRRLSLGLSSSLTS
jgi:hypothetical protein